MAFPGTKLSLDPMKGRIVNMLAWRKDTHKEICKTEMGPYAGFLTGELVSLDCELTKTSIAATVMSPTNYLQGEMDQIKISLLTSLGLTPVTVLLPENSTHNNNLNRNLIGFISDYKKICRKLSSLLLTTVDENISEAIQGLNDFSELSEHPIYVYHAMLILAEIPSEVKTFEMLHILTELNALTPSPQESITMYISRYQRALNLYLTLGGKDLVVDRASNFILSLTALSHWREVVQREYMTKINWYVTWPPGQNYTTKAIFQTLASLVSSKIAVSTQVQALFDRRAGINPVIEKVTDKTPKALAAAKEDGGDVIVPCAFCKALNKPTADKHNAENCFGIMGIAKAIKKKDSGPFEKIGSILDAGGFPQFTPRGDVYDSNEMPARSGGGGKTGGGGGGRSSDPSYVPTTYHSRPYPKTVTRKPVESKTALIAASTSNFFSALLDSSDDGDEPPPYSEDDHSAFPAIDYDKLKYSLSVVGTTAVRIIADTGCTNHLFGDPLLLWNVREIPATTFKGMASVTITLVGESTFGSTFLYPGMGFNLVSWSQLKRDKDVLDTVRSFDDNDDSFTVSLRGNVPLVFNLDASLDLYVLDGSDATFSSQTEKVKSAFPARKTKATVPPVPSTVVPAVVPATLVPTPVASTPQEEVAVPGLGVVTGLPLTPHARKRAEEARRLHCALGHPSDHAMRLTLATVMTNSSCNASDVTTAHKLFGECIDCAKGKQTLITTGGTHNLAMEVGQVLHTDIIFGRNGKDVITKKPTMASWLLCVDELTGYMLIVEIVTKATDKLLEGLLKVTSFFQRYGHVVRKVMIDSESALKSCTVQMGSKGIELLPRPPGEHEKHAEAHTRYLRARMRAIESRLGYELPDVLSTYLAIAACFSYNLVPNNRSALGSPHTYVTGGSVDATIYGKFVFGDPVLIPSKETHTSTNREEARASEGMFLGHLYGQVGSAYFLTFPATSKANVQIRAVESVRTMIPTTTYMESIRALRPIGTVVPMSTDDELYRVVTAKDFADYVAQARILSTKPHKGGGERLRFAKNIVQPDPVVMHEPVRAVTEETEEVAEPAPAEVEEVHTDNSAREQDSTGLSPDPVGVTKEPADPAPLRSGRANKGGRKTPRFYYAEATNAKDSEVKVNFFDTSHVALIASLSEELVKYGEAGMKALSKEAQQLIDLMVFEPTDLGHTMHTLPREDRYELGILDTKCFLEMKRDGRCKARIVAGTGRTRQNPDQYGQVDSAAIRTESVMILIKVAAQQMLNLSVLDVPGAFLHATMQDLRKGHDPDTPRYVRLSGMLAEVIVRLKPEWKQFMNDKGEVIMELKRALYGLIEASRLWMLEITSTLIANGFVQSLLDPCLYIHKERNLIVAVYVDDFLAAHDGRVHLDWLIGLLTAKYGAPRVQTGDVIDYLNIRIRRVVKPFEGLPVGSYVIDQSEYAKTMIEKYSITGQSDIPHKGDFFEVDADSPKLQGVEATTYVSICMSLLFTCNRVRVDVFLHTSFLCTRLKEPTEQDMTKLMRVMEYINSTMNYGMAFSSGDKTLNVYAWIDASYAVHDDAKGHSGTVVSIGNVADVLGNVVYVKSRKQKLVGRSSTEAELIALHDGLPQIVWTRNLLSELGYTQPPAEVFQDNKSTIFMSEQGRGNHARSKHIDVRYFFAKGLMENKIVKLTHLGTEEMVADAFTKVMSSVDFLRMRDALLINLAEFGKL